MSNQLSLQLNLLLINQKVSNRLNYFPFDQSTNSHIKGAHHEE